MAAYWTAIGAMLIPLAVVLVVEIPNAFSFSSVWSWIALGLIAFGVASILIGWSKTLAEERQRRREGKTFLLVLASIAQKLGVDIDDLVEKTERFKYEK